MICIALMLSACAETRLAMHAAKQISPQPEVAKGHYKIGNPYQKSFVTPHAFGPHQVGFQVPGWKI